MACFWLVMGLAKSCISCSSGKELGWAYQLMDGANGEYYARAELTTMRKWQCWVAEGDGCALVVVSRAKRAREEIYFGERGVRSATPTVLLSISLSSYLP